MFWKNFIIFAITIIGLNVDGCPDPLIDCSRERVSFHLYTEKDKPPHELLLDNPDSVKNAPFLPDTGFKLIIHGFWQDKDAPTMLRLREEYFKQKPWNLINIDWPTVAKEDCYWDTAFPSIPKVGECGANMLRQIFQHRPEIKVEQFHVIGFSMGAHVSAQVANNLNPLILPRITGLDPALPGFHDIVSDDQEVLNKKHAHFVDVIHANMGILGVYFSSAHYDIYLNNGVDQPGCDLTDVSCSHSRAIEVFTESINSKEIFLAHKCKRNWKWITLRICDGAKEIKIEAGEHVKPPAEEKEEGIYELETNDKPPFAKHPPQS